MDIPALSGPFKLTSSNLAIQVRGAVPGAFVLGPLRMDGHLTVKLTGRADDLAQALRAHIERYEAFGFVRASSSEEALATECLLFHHFEPADNAGHPQIPEGSNWRCPVCEQQQS